jgi:hypothetical protein
MSESDCEIFDGFLGRTAPRGDSTWWRDPSLGIPSGKIFDGFPEKRRLSRATVECIVAFSQPQPATYGFGPH